MSSMTRSHSLTLIDFFLSYPYNSLDTRILIDRGACQALAIEGYKDWEPTITGSAEHCFKAVFLNLALTDTLILWLEWIFLCLPVVKWDKADRAATIAKFKTVVLLTIVYVNMVFVFHTPEWLIQCVLAGWAFLVKMHTFRLYIASFRHAPAAGTEAAQPLDEAEEEGGGVLASFRWKNLKGLAKTGLLQLYMIDPLEDLHDDDDNDQIHEKIE